MGWGERTGERGEEKERGKGEKRRKNGGKGRRGGKGKDHRVGGRSRDSWGKSGLSCE